MFYLSFVPSGYEERIKSKVKKVNIKELLNRVKSSSTETEPPKKVDVDINVGNVGDENIDNRHDLDNSNLKRSNAIRRYDLRGRFVSEQLNLKTNSDPQIERNRNLFRRTIDGTKYRLARKNAFRKNDPPGYFNSAFIDDSSGNEEEETDNLKPPTTIRSRSDVGLTTKKVDNNTEPPSEIHPALKDVHNLNDKDEDDTISVSSKATDLSISTLDDPSDIRLLECFLENSETCLVKNINEESRRYLAEWLIAMHSSICKNTDQHEILYYAVFILDKVLKGDCVALNEKSVSLPLLAFCCLTQALKNAPKSFPEVVEELCTNTEFEIEYEQFENMEELIGSCVARLPPQSCHFLKRYTRAVSFNDKQNSLASYILEISLLRGSVSRKPPPLVAVSSLFLALSLVGKLKDNFSTVYYSEYSEDDILNVVKELIKMMIKLDKSQPNVIHTKYSTEEFSFVSTCEEVQPKYLQSMCNKLFTW